MTNEETFVDALKRHISDAGYSLNKTRDQVKIAGELNISIPFLERLINDKEDVTAELDEKLSLFFKTEAGYWGDLQKKRDGPRVPQIIEGVPFSHQLSERVSEAAKWPHADFAAQLAREHSCHGTFIEIEPNLFMGAESVKREDLVCVFDVFYVERKESGGFTLWAGKRATYSRPKTSSKWFIHTVEPLDRSSRSNHLQGEFLGKVFRSWGLHEWDHNAEDFPYDTKRTMKLLAKSLLSIDELALATTPDLESLLRSSFRILAARRQDDILYQYEATADTGNNPGKPKFLVAENDGDGNVVNRPVKFKDLGRTVHGKVQKNVKHLWEATFQAKNGSVENGNVGEIVDEDEIDAPNLLINGHRIDLRELTGMYMEKDRQQLVQRIKRCVSGIRGEFLEEVKAKLLELRKYRNPESDEGRMYVKSQRIPLEEYVEWASKGTDTFEVQRVFQYGFDHRYDDDGSLPYVLLLTAENTGIATKIIPFPPHPKATRRGRGNDESRYATGRVWVPAKNGDGIKFCVGSDVHYYFPYNGELFKLRDDAFTEARFLRYVDGYRREILPEVEKHRESKIRYLADDSQATVMKAELDKLDQFIEWLNER